MCTTSSKAGVLAIKFGNEAKWTEYYAPGGDGGVVIAKPNHQPGHPGGTCPHT